MEPKSVTLKYNITPADYLDAVRLNGRKKRRLSFLLLGLSLLLGLLAWLVEGSDAILPICISAWAGAMLVYLPIVYFWWLPARVKKLYLQQKLLHQEITAEITDQAFKTSLAQGQSEIPWDTYYAWAEDSRMIILKHSQVMFQMLPKRCFASAEDIEWLRGILTAKVKK